jgi:hypothetical protein
LPSTTACSPPPFVLLSYSSFRLSFYQFLTSLDEKERDTMAAVSSRLGCAVVYCAITDPSKKIKWDFRMIAITGFSLAKEKWTFFLIVQTVLYSKFWTNCDAWIVDGQLDWDFSSRKMNPEFHAQEDRGEHSDWLNDHQIFQSILVEVWPQILLADLCNHTFLDQLDWDFSSRKVNAKSQGFSHKKTHNGESTVVWRWSDFPILLLRGMVKDPSKINDWLQLRFSFFAEAKMSTTFRDCWNRASFALHKLWCMHRWWAIS